MKWVGITLIILTLAWGFQRIRPKPVMCDSVTIQTEQGTVLTAEVAQTAEAQAKGLAGRTSLAPHHGMLFLFSNSDDHTFWMKDTLIPLDILWLDNQVVIDRATLFPQEGTTVPSYTPKSKANAVLELNAGEADSLGLTTGSTVRWECQP